MKQFRWPLLALAVVVTLGWSISSCRKINEATALGGGLVPEVDNINTFDTVLEVNSNNVLRNDSANVSVTDEMAIGYLADPDFGTTKADLYFNIGPTTYKTHPFYHRDSVQDIDSVVLSLACTGNFYGDTTSTMSFSVSEINDPAFKDSSYYPVQRDAFTTGPTLGSKSFALRSLKDTTRLIRAGDTTRVANVVRIRLDNNALGERLASYDTTTASTIGAYANYTNFYRLVPGLAVKASTSGNSIGYFTIADTTRTRLIVYYRVKRGGVIDTTSAGFPAGIYGAGFQSTTGTSADLKPRSTQANLIKRTPGGGFQTQLGNGTPNDNLVYIQSDPGSGATIYIPGLSTLSNRVVHRAELILTREPTGANSYYSAPPNLLLARGSGIDSLRGIVDDSISATVPSGAVNTALFGGNLMLDGTYRFNITRQVQGIITYGRPNDTLFVFAPFRYTLKDPRFFAAQRTVTVLPRIAYGRAVLTGGSHPDPARRMRLRIIYSRI